MFKSNYACNIPAVILPNNLERVSLTTLNRISRNNNDDDVLFFRSLSVFYLKHPIVYKIIPYNHTLKQSLFFFQRHLSSIPLNKAGHSFVTSLFKQHSTHTQDIRLYQRPMKHRNGFSILTGYTVGWPKR